MQEPPARPPDGPAAPERKNAPAEGERSADEDGGHAPAGVGPRPATVDDLRSLRRWLLVASVWAVAATAIGVIALVVANRFDEDELNARTAGQIREVQRDLENRIDELETRIGELPTSEDISDLDNRLGEVEDRLGNTSDQLDRLSARLDDLDQRVEELEQTGTETQTETETTP
jgi:uncharacterized coiled-coil protein SlyX